MIRLFRPDVRLEDLELTWFIDPADHAYLSYWFVSYRKYGPDDVYYVFSDEKGKHELRIRNEFSWCDTPVSELDLLGGIYNESQF